MNNFNGGIPPQLMNNIRQVKQMMNMAQNPNAILQNNPMLNQIMQAYQGQSPQQIFSILCQQNGFDPNAIMNELRN